MSHTYPDQYLNTYTSSSSRFQARERPLFKMEGSSAAIFVRLIVKVYPSRVSLEYSPVFGSWQREESFAALDFGNIYINKSRRRAVVGVKKINSQEKLFEVPNLAHDDAEAFKSALDKLVVYRYNYANQSSVASF